MVDKLLRSQHLIEEVAYPMACGALPVCKAMHRRSQS